MSTFLQVHQLLTESALIPYPIRSEFKECVADKISSLVHGSAIVILMFHNSKYFSIYQA